MRRFLPLLVLPLVLVAAACSDQGDKKPAAEAQPTQPAVTQPVTQPAKTTTTATGGAAASNAALAPILGNWAVDASQCAKPIQISQAKFVGNSSCDISGFADNGDGTFTATCGSQKLKMEPLFGPAGEGVRITAGDAKPVTVFRCSTPKAQ